MRKLKLQVHITVDGFGSRKNGNNDWIFASGPDEAGFQKLTDLANTCDTVLLGHHMAPMFLGHWRNMAASEQASSQKAFGQVISNMRQIVFSRTQTSSSMPDTEFENGDLVQAVQALKAEAGKDIIMYGCGDLVKALIENDLFDEYYLIVNAVALGDGITVFNKEKSLTLESSVAFRNGKVLNKYLPL